MEENLILFTGGLLSILGGIFGPYIEDYFSDAIDKIYKIIFSILLISWLIVFLYVYFQFGFDVAIYVILIPIIIYILSIIILASLFFVIVFFIFGGLIYIGGGGSAGAIFAIIISLLLYVLLIFASHKFEKFEENNEWGIHLVIIGSVIAGFSSFSGHFSLYGAQLLNIANFFLRFCIFLTIGFICNYLSIVYKNRVEEYEFQKRRAQRLGKELPSPEQRYPHIIEHIFEKSSIYGITSVILGLIGVILIYIIITHTSSTTNHIGEAALLAQIPIGIISIISGYYSKIKYKDKLGKIGVILGLITIGWLIFLLLIIISGFGSDPQGLGEILAYAICITVPIVITIIIVILVLKYEKMKKRN